MTVAIERLVGFGRHLRTRGLPVGTGRILSFCRAVEVLRPTTRDHVYWAARATLVARQEDLELFEQAFHAYFESDDLEAMAASSIDKEEDAERRSPDQLADGPAANVQGWIPSEINDGTEDEAVVGVVASRAEILRNKSFEDLNEEERAQAAALIRRLVIDMPRRRRRRLRTSSKGRHLDLRGTLRNSLRTQGEPFRRAWRRRRVKMRPLVLVLDVSGSMSPYSRSLMQFAFAAMIAGHRVEVFCFGTRLTRLTRTFRTKDPNRAMKDIADVVHDWEGGTRIGDSVRDLLDRYGGADFVRGAVVVFCSDGLDRGDPEVLASEMSRLARRAHRVIWVNPLKGSPLYQPVARGMAAALPHIDVFLPGHNVTSLEALAEVLAA